MKRLGSRVGDEVSLGGEREREWMNDEDGQIDENVFPV